MEEQIARGDVRNVRAGVYKQLSLLGIERSRIDSVALRVGAERQIKEVVPIGQKVRPVVASFLPAGIQRSYRSRRASRGRDATNRHPGRARCPRRPEQHASLLAPAAVGADRRLGKSLSRAAGDGDLL